jgi:hypothetical protein
MKNDRLKWLFVLLLVAAASCSPKSKNSEESQMPVLQPKAAHSEPAPAPTATAGLKFTPPPGWIAETPASTSRKAQYKIPRAEGDSEDANLVVYYFNGGGGAPQANIDRWIAEFSGPGGKPASNNAKVTHKTINGIPFTLVDVSGTYASSMGSMMQSEAPKSGTRLLGAIAETGSGPWFIKLTGPEKTVAKAESGFQAFLNSVTASE